jgi:flavin reductase (DIM6/NTAB) family NADH-FMN oxidoreductase RutF
MIHAASITPDPVDQRALRTALGRFATGVTVVTTRTPDGKIEGLTANSFAAVSLDPPLVLWSLRRHAPSLRSFQASGTFAVNVLARSQEEIAHRFATRNREKFAGVEHTPGLGGAPLLHGTLAAFECSLESILEGGDHVILLGRVHRVSQRDGEPLIFSGGRYGTHSALTPLS